MKFKNIYFPPSILDSIKKTLTNEELSDFYHNIITEDLKDDKKQIDDFLSNNVGAEPTVGQNYYPSEIIFLVGQNKIQIDYVENATFVKYENNIYYFTKDKKSLDFPLSKGPGSIYGANILENSDQLNHFLSIVRLTFPESIINITKL